MSHIRIKMQIKISIVVYTQNVTTQHFKLHHKGHKGKNTQSTQLFKVES